MYYNHAKGEAIKAGKESYDELKKVISTLEEDNKLSQYCLAYEHILEMERTIEKQNKELERYRAFFSTLQSLLPERFFDSHKLIG